VHEAGKFDLTPKPDSIDSRQVVRRAFADSLALLELLLLCRDCCGRPRTCESIAVCTQVAEHQEGWRRIYENHHPTDELELGPQFGVMSQAIPCRNVHQWRGCTATAATSLCARHTKRGVHGFTRHVRAGVLLASPGSPEIMAIPRSRDLAPYDPLSSILGVLARDSSLMRCDLTGPLWRELWTVLVEVG
jgi:hypothetical protein